MKKSIVFLICVFIGITDLHAVKCFQEGGKAAQEYFENVREKQFGRDEAEWETYSDDEKQEKRTRNICINSYYDIIMECTRYNCMKKRGTVDKYVPCFLHRDLTGPQICAMIDSVDCWNDDVAKIIPFLRTSGATIADMFLLDMDKITTEIRSDSPYSGYIDANKETCFTPDTNGDTIWHAFLDTQKNVHGFGNMCLSFLNDNEKQFLYEAVFLAENDSGQTAIAKAAEIGKLEYFRIFADYLEQEGNDCRNLVDAIKQSTGVSLDDAQIKSLCGYVYSN